MIIKQLKITNVSGDSIEFDRHFRLSKDIDFSALNASVVYKTSTTDGSSYQSTKLDNRDFDIPFYIHRKHADDRWIEEKRTLAFKVFNPKKNPMRLDVVTKSGEEYYLYGNLEGAPSFPIGFENANRGWQNGLLQFSSSDPYIYQKDARTVDIALWVPTFEFPLEIPQDTGIEMGYRQQSLIVNVLNDGQESTGMKIRFKALGTVVNPSLLNVNTYEEMKINMTMSAGDNIEVSTYQRKKSVILIRNGVASNIFNYLDLSSTFLQLETGDNLFRYNAVEGLDNLEVSMNFTPRKLGV